MIDGRERSRRDKERCYVNVAFRVERKKKNRRSRNT
jgi:hypothetical protein